MTRTAQAATLLIAGIVLAFGAWVVRDRALEDWEYDQSVDRMTNAMLTDIGSDAARVDSDQFDDAPYLAAWTVSGLLVLGAFIIYGTTRPD